MSRDSHHRPGLKYYRLLFDIENTSQHNECTKTSFSTPPQVNHTPCTLPAQDQKDDNCKDNRGQKDCRWVDQYQEEPWQKNSLIDHLERNEEKPQLDHLQTVGCYEYDTLEDDTFQDMVFEDDAYQDDLVQRGSASRGSMAEYDTPSNPGLGILAVEPPTVEPTRVEHDLCIHHYASGDSYCLTVGTVIILRRCRDDWVNVTQIVKLTSLTATAWSVCLQQVKLGDHEIIYSSKTRSDTWIALQSARELAESFGLPGVSVCSRLS